MHWGTTNLSGRAAAQMHLTLQNKRILGVAIVDWKIIYTISIRDTQSQETWLQKQKSGC